MIRVTLKPATQALAPIGDNIQQMIAAVDAEMQQLRARLDTLAKRKSTLMEWLDEEHPAQGGLALALSEMGKGSSPLSAFLRSAISRHGALTTDALAEMAEASNLIEEGKSSRRTVNFAMQSLANANVAQNTENGWILVK